MLHAQSLPGSEPFGARPRPLCLATALFLPHPEDLSSVAVIHLNVKLFQEVLQLLKAHLIVLVLVSFSQAGMNPAG